MATKKLANLDQVKAAQERKKASQAVNPELEQLRKDVAVMKAEQDRAQAELLSAMNTPLHWGGTAAYTSGHHVISASSNVPGHYTIPIPQAGWTGPNVVIGIGGVQGGPSAKRATIAEMKPLFWAAGYYIEFAADQDAVRLGSQDLEIDCLIDLLTFTRQCDAAGVFSARDVARTLVALTGLNVRGSAIPRQK